MVATLDQVFREEWGRVLASLIGFPGSRDGSHPPRPALTAKFGLLVAGDRAEVPMNTTTFPDERLEFVFTCCHPALAVEAQVALTLRTLGGRARHRGDPRRP